MYQIWFRYTNIVCPKSSLLTWSNFTRNKLINIGLTLSLYTRINLNTGEDDKTKTSIQGVKHVEVSIIISQIKVRVQQPLLEVHCWVVVRKMLHIYSLKLYIMQLMSLTKWCDMQFESDQWEVEDSSGKNKYSYIEI